MIPDLEEKAERLGIKKLHLARVAGIDISTWKRWRKEGLKDARIALVKDYLRGVADVSRTYGIK